MSWRSRTEEVSRTGGEGTGGEEGRSDRGGSGGICQVTGRVGNAGSFGKGGTGPNGLYGGTGGGGGGWFGGGSGVEDGHVGTVTSGGGGSGYVLNASSYKPSGYALGSEYYLSNAQTIAGNQSFPAPGGGNETGHSGNGYARITLVE